MSLDFHRKIGAAAAIMGFKGVGKWELVVIDKQHRRQQSCKEAAATSTGRNRQIDPLARGQGIFSRT